MHSTIQRSTVSLLLLLLARTEPRIPGCILQIASVMLISHESDSLLSIVNFFIQKGEAGDDHAEAHPDSYFQSL